MTDKKLLELAAKAAKKQLWWHNESAYSWHKDGNTAAVRRASETAR